MEQEACPQQSSGRAATANPRTTSRRVVSRCVQLVEHPELVSQRIERYASIVGRENVLASNDCGFATSAAGDEVNTEVAWAKLDDALVEGARIASARLWPRSAAA
jgi:5-methyltetrahydropteroyltriglutamate--homocysteine methyltransferase